MEGGSGVAPGSRSDGNTCLHVEWSTQVTKFRCLSLSFLLNVKCATGWTTDTTVHAEETRLSTNGRSGGNDFFSSQTRASSRPGWVVGWWGK